MDNDLGLLGRSDFDDSFHGSLELHHVQFGDDTIPTTNTANLGTSLHKGYTDGKFRETAAGSLLSDASSTGAVQTNQNANSTLRDAIADHCRNETRSLAPRKRPHDTSSHGFDENLNHGTKRAHSSEKKDCWDVMYERLCAYKSEHGVRFYC